MYTHWTLRCRRVNPHIKDLFKCVCVCPRSIMIETEFTKTEMNNVNMLIFFKIVLWAFSILITARFYWLKHLWNSSFNIVYSFDIIFHLHPQILPSRWIFSFGNKKLLHKGRPDEYRGTILCFTKSCWSKVQQDLIRTYPEMTVLGFIV